MMDVVSMLTSSVIKPLLNTFDSPKLRTTTATEYISKFQITFVHFHVDVIVEKISHTRCDV